MLGTKILQYSKTYSSNFFFFFFFLFYFYFLFLFLLVLFFSYTVTLLYQWNLALGSHFSVHPTGRFLFPLLRASQSLRLLQKHESESESKSVSETLSQRPFFTSLNTLFFFSTLCSLCVLGLKFCDSYYNFLPLMCHCTCFFLFVFVKHINGVEDGSPNPIPIPIPITTSLNLSNFTLTNSNKLSLKHPPKAPNFEAFDALFLWGLQNCRA